MNLLSPVSKSIIGTTLVFILFAAGFLYMGKQNLWFEKKVILNTHFKNAEGLRVGTSVSISGLKVGEIVSLDVNDDHQVDVKFSVKKSAVTKIREDSQARIVRSLIIGEKRIEISKGESSSVVKEFGVLEGIDSQEIADLLSGGNVHQFLSRFDSLGTGLNNLNILLSQILKETSSKDQKSKLNQVGRIVNGIESLTVQLPPVLRDMQQTFKGINRDILDNHLGSETFQSVKEMSGVMTRNEQLLVETMNNLSKITSEFAKNPQLSGQLLQALNEATLTLKAIQRTWLLSDHVKAVEEKERTKQQTK